MVEFDLAGKVIRRFVDADFHQGCLDMLKRYPWIRTLVLDVISAGPVRTLVESPAFVHALGRVVKVVGVEDRDDLKAQVEKKPSLAGAWPRRTLAGVNSASFLIRVRGQEVVPKRGSQGGGWCWVGKCWWLGWEWRMGVGWRDGVHGRVGGDSRTDHCLRRVCCVCHEWCE